MVAILKILKRHLLPKGESDWWEELGFGDLEFRVGIGETWRHGDSELLNSFHSDIYDGLQGHFEILQMTSSPKP